MPPGRMGNSGHSRVACRGRASRDPDPACPRAALSSSHEVCVSLFSVYLYRYEIMYREDRKVVLRTTWARTGQQADKLTAGGPAAGDIPCKRTHDSLTSIESTGGPEL